MANLEMAESLLRIGVPIGFAAYGELLLERAGIVNLGIEGKFLLGACLGWLLTSMTGHPFIGLISVIIMGAFLGGIFWFLIDVLECSQHVVGLGMGFSATGIALTLYRVVPAEIKDSALPYTGWEVVSLIVLAALLFAGFILLAIFFTRTGKGLSWVLVGEDARAADILGLPVRLIRIGASVTGTILFFIAGWILSVLVARNFTLGLVSGRGWLALCLVILAGWRPLGVTLAVVLWSILDVSQFAAQGAGMPIPYELILTVPYCVCILAVTGFLPRHRAPNMLLKTYNRNEDAA